MPAVLLELGFLSNGYDVNYFENIKNFETMVLRIYMGFI